MTNIKTITLSSEIYDNLLNIIEEQSEDKELNLFVNGFEKIKREEERISKESDKNDIISIELF